MAPHKALLFVNPSYNALHDTKLQNETLQALALHSGVFTLPTINVEGSMNEGPT